MVSNKFFILAVFLFIILLSAGCVSSSTTQPVTGGTVNATATASSLPATSPSIISPAPASCLAKSTGSIRPATDEFFIMINPVSHYYIGEIITFDGTTNLPHGEMIQLQIHSGEFVPCPKSIAGCEGSVRPCCGGFSDTVSLIGGPCGISTWSWAVNTSEHGFRSDGEYLVYASGREGLVQNYSIFTVNGIPQPNLTLNLPENGPDATTLLLSG